MLIKSLQTGMYCRVQNNAAGSNGLRGLYATRLKRRASAAPPPRAARVQAFPKAKRTPPSMVSALGGFPSAATLMGVSASSLVGSIIVCDVAVRDAVVPMAWTGAGGAASCCRPSHFARSLVAPSCHARAQGCSKCPALGAVPFAFMYKHATTRALHLPAELIQSGMPLASPSQNALISLNSSAASVLPELLGSTTTSGLCRAATRAPPPFRPRPPPATLPSLGKPPPGATSGTAMPPPAKKVVGCRSPPRAGTTAKLRPPPRQGTGMGKSKGKPPPRAGAILVKVPTGGVAKGGSGGKAKAPPLQGFARTPTPWHTGASVLAQAPPRVVAPLKRKPAPNQRQVDTFGFPIAASKPPPTSPGAGLLGRQPSPAPPTDIQAPWSRAAQPWPSPISSAKPLGRAKPSPSGAKALPPLRQLAAGQPPAIKKLTKARPPPKPAHAPLSKAQPSTAQALHAQAPASPTALASHVVPYLQSDGTNRLFPTGAGPVMLSTDGSAALLLTANGSVTFAGLETGATLWSASAAGGSGPAQLELAADGELRLITVGQVLWKAGTAGKGSGPFRLTAQGQDLALRDLASNRTIWLAPVGCSAFGAAQLQPLAQCGGALSRATQQAPVQAAVKLADAPWQNTCCPTGHRCSKSGSSTWLCQPSGVLDGCSGPKTLPVHGLCGGINLCGRDAACSASCCSDGNYCRRLSAFTWSCAPLASFSGGLL